MDNLTQFNTVIYSVLFSFLFCMFSMALILFFKSSGNIVLAPNDGLVISTFSWISVTPTTS